MIVTCGQDDDLRDEKPPWWVICQNRQRRSKTFRNMTMTAVIRCRDVAGIAAKHGEVWGIWGNYAAAIAEVRVRDPKTENIGTAPPPDPT